MWGKLTNIVTPFKRDIFSIKLQFSKTWVDSIIYYKKFGRWIILKYSTIWHYRKTRMIMCNLHSEYIVSRIFYFASWGALDHTWCKQTAQNVSKIDDRLIIEECLFWMLWPLYLKKGSTCSVSTIHAILYVILILSEVGNKIGW